MRWLDDSGLDDKHRWLIGLGREHQRSEFLRCDGEGVGQHGIGERHRAALERADVSNADRWAQEVVEYRPYPSDDPNLGKLRKNLAKYNPSQETVDKIVSTLTP